MSSEPTETNETNETNAPTGKDVRQRRNLARALARFSVVFYRHMRRHAVRLDALEVRVQSLQDRVDDLADQLSATQTGRPVGTGSGYYQKLRDLPDTTEVIPTVEETTGE